MNPIELKILKELGVPTDPAPEKVLILSVTAHMDWDWEFTFPEYYEAYHCTSGYWKYPVRQIFSNAVQYVEASLNKTPPYFYSISVVDYLKKFAEDRPDWFERLLALGDRFRIVGDGVTSPDNLLPNGETLIRTYLLTDVWLRQRVPADPGNGLPPLPHARQAWVPDDFGHSAGFPIILQALGFEAVGFSRLPTSTGQELVEGDHKGVDFIWEAADGSRVLAHWMQDNYYQGQHIHPTIAIEKLTQYSGENDPDAPTPYAYVPVSIDFGQPIESIREVASTWNEAKYETTGVWVVGATFDHYAQLVGCYMDSLHVRTYPEVGETPSLLPFQPTPYWTGFYGSRPELKSLHQEATRALVGAEVFGLIDGCLRGSGVSADVAGGWWKLTPSTHHDYITGTSVNAVYTSEQIPLLQQALQAGSTARAAAVASIAASTAKAKTAEATAEPAGNGSGPMSAAGAALVSVDSLPFLVLNQLGFDRGGLVEIEAVGTFAPNSFSVAGAPRGPVQVTADGRWLFNLPDDCPAPSMGYRSVTLESAAWQGSGFEGASFRLAPDGKSATLENSALRATISEAADWCLEELDEVDNGAFVPTFTQGQQHRTLVYQDGGTLYQFGNELDRTFSAQDTTFTPKELKVLSGGPVFVQLEVSGSYSADGTDIHITRTYALAAGDPFVRITTKGAAPPMTSIFDTIPWGPIDTFWHGEPVHWIAKRALPMGELWSRPIFQPAHDFVIPRSKDGVVLGAVYQSALPAWAVVPPDDQLMGCLLRNVPDYDNNPGDRYTHQVTYALRVPKGLAAPETGQPLKESLALTTPLQASSLSGAPPATFSLASVRVEGSPAGTTPAILTAAKPSVDDPESMVLRIYRASRQALILTVTVTDVAASRNGAALAAYPISALERIDTKGDPIPITDGSFSVHAEFALTTLLVGPAP